MEINFTCPSCRSIFKAPIEKEGDLHTCPSCFEQIVLPPGKLSRLQVTVVASLIVGALCSIVGLIFLSHLEDQKLNQSDPGTPLAELSDEKRIEFRQKLTESIFERRIESWEDYSKLYDELISRSETEEERRFFAEARRSTLISQVNQHPWHRTPNSVEDAKRRIGELIRHSSSAEDRAFLEEIRGGIASAISISNSNALVQNFSARGESIRKVIVSGFFPDDMDLKWLVVPRGTYFSRSASNYQNMVSVRSVCWLAQKEKFTELPVNVACADKSKSVPTKVVLDIGPIPRERPKLRQLFDYLNSAELDLDSGTGQAAVWIVTDDPSLDDLVSVRVGTTITIALSEAMAPVPLPSAIEGYKVVVDAGFDAAAFKIFQDVDEMASYLKSQVEDPWKPDDPAYITRVSLLQNWLNQRFATKLSEPVSPPTITPERPQRMSVPQTKRPPMRSIKEPKIDSVAPLRWTKDHDELGREHYVLERSEGNPIVEYQNWAFADSETSFEARLDRIHVIDGNLHGEFVNKDGKAAQVEVLKLSKGGIEAIKEKTEGMWPVPSGPLRGQ